MSRGDQLVMIPEIGFISNEGNLLTDRYKKHAGTSIGGWGAGPGEVARHVTKHEAAVSQSWLCRTRSVFGALSS
jgi:hypothetical protein